MTTNTSLRDEILGEMILNDNNGVIHSVLYGILTEKILKLFEKRIDEIERINTPENFNNINTREQQNIMYYRLALGDIKEMLLKE